MNWVRAALRSEQKHKAQSKSFEWLMWGFVGMFCLWVVLSAIEGLTGLTFLGVPSFGVCVVAPLTGKQKWVKRIWDLSPYVVGILIAVLWMSKGDGGPFYDIGYDIGQWFGELF